MNNLSVCGSLLFLCFGIFFVFVVVSHDVISQTHPKRLQQQIRQFNREQRLLHKTRQRLSNNQDIHVQPLEVKQPVAEVKPFSCDLTQFKERLSLESRDPVIPRENLATCHHVIYNNVPKTGSRMFKGLMSGLGPANNFTALLYRSGFSRGVSKKDLVATRLASAENGRFVYVSHFRFADFTDLYPDVVYINLVREPVEFFKSIFFFHKYGDSAHPRDHPKMDYFDVTIEECINDDECFNNVTTLINNWIFLSPSDISRDCVARSPSCITRVLAHLDRYHLVVGVMEQMGRFYEVLEYLMPQMFTNISQAYSAKGLALYNSTKTARKDDLPLATAALLREKLAMEYRFYDVIRDRFNALWTAVSAAKRKQQAASP